MFRSGRLRGRDLQLVGDFLEDGGELASDGRNRANDDDSDEAGDEAVLDRGRAGLVPDETIEHGHTLAPCLVALSVDMTLGGRSEPA